MFGWTDRTGIFVPNIGGFGNAYHKGPYGAAFGIVWTDSASV